MPGSREGTIPVGRMFRLPSCCAASGGSVAPWVHHPAHGWACEMLTRRPRLSRAQHHLAHSRPWYQYGALPAHRVARPSPWLDAAWVGPAALRLLSQPFCAPASRAIHQRRTANQKPRAPSPVAVPSYPIRCLVLQTVGQGSHVGRGIVADALSRAADVPCLGVDLLDLPDRQSTLIDDGACCRGHAVQARALAC